MTKHPRCLSKLKLLWLTFLTGWCVSGSIHSVTAVATEETAIAAEAQEFVLQDGQTVLFLGDSITYGDLYIQYLDAYLYTRYPTWQISLINRGIPSETAAGTSEPTHAPPRPDVHTRFTSTAPPLKPTVVFLCYGMNDGVYQSPNDEIMKKYQSGMTRLVQRVRSELKVDPIVLTPPPFDYRPFAKKQPPADLKEPDYRFPAADYDDTLASFTAWLKTQQTAGLKVRVIDLHTPLSQVLKTQRNQRDDFALAGDGIHPGPTGHWLMAQAILRGLRANDLAQVSLQQAASEEGIEFIAKKQLLPVPADPRLDPGVSLPETETENILDKISSHHLFITGLSPKQEYELSADGKPFATATGTELQAGLALGSYPDFPLNQKSQQVLKLVQERRQILREVWIKAETHPRMASEHERLLKTSKATAEQAAELDAQIRQLCQPVDLKLTVKKKTE